MKLLIPPPVVALLCAGLIWLCGKFVPPAGFQFPGQTEIAILLVFAGIVVDFVAIRQFTKAQTTINPNQPSKTSALVTDGIYRYTRNPMYLGMVIFLSAFGIWMGNWLFIPVAAIFIWFISRFQIRPEEEILLEKFGEPYGEYCLEVRRWI